MGASTLEEIRDVYRELRVIAQQIDDKVVRGRLRAATERLCAANMQSSADTAPPLAPREIDVLAEVALGCSNSEAAARLSVSAETVKAYLKSAMRKLDAHNRHQAVSAARRHRLLP